MKSQNGDDGRKSHLNPVHGSLADRNIFQFLNAMEAFDDARPKASRLRLVHNLIQLIKISDAGSASKAAGEEAQTNLSNALTILEQFFGCQLREPQPGPLTLTPRAQHLVEIARFALASFGEFYQDCCRLPRTYNIAAGDTLLHLVLFPELSRIQERMPETIFNVENLHTKEIQTALGDCRIDFALVREEALHGVRNLEKPEAIGTYRYGICYPKTTNGLQRPLETFPVALKAKHWGKDFLQMAREANVALNVKVQCETFIQVIRLVQTGDYAGIVPQFAEEVLPRDKYNYVEAEFLKGVEYKIVLVWNKRMANIKSKMKEVAAVLKEELAF